MWSWEDGPLGSYFISPFPCFSEFWYLGVLKDRTLEVRLCDFKSGLPLHSKIPNSQKVWEIINICFYKLICFRVICHTAVYSLCTILLLKSKDTCHLHSITLSQSFGLTLILVSGVQSFLSISRHDCGQNEPKCQDRWLLPWWYE